MRILANYGYKNNGDTYSVTFETVGDVPKEHADSVVDELFGMARRAIERQINGKSAIAQHPEKETEEIPIPIPGQNKESADKRNGSKPQLKDPEAPATKKQRSFIVKLAKERGQFIENLDSLTMSEASRVIDELMTVAV